MAAKRHSDLQEKMQTDATAVTITTDLWMNDPYMCLGNYP